MLITRRSFLGGLGLALAAPVIVRAASLMPVRDPFLTDPTAWFLRDPPPLEELDTTSLSETSLEQALIEIRSFTERSYRVMMVPTRVLYCNALERPAALRTMSHPRRA